jgi:predicted RNase H-like HicB family nuclease
MSSAPVLTSYLDAAMRLAHYELIDGGTAVYAEIRELPGVYASGPTVEECRAELREVLEEWVLLGLTLHHPIPPVEGIELAIREAI